MSLLDKIKLKKNCLNPTETKVTSPSGCVSIETKSGSFILKDRSCGFVVDTKPDLQVAQIFDYLYMGSQDPACDRDLLQRYKITRILSLDIEVPKFDGITYYNLPVLDIPEFDIKSFLKEAFSIIDSSKESHERIFVHCNAGISRSASVIIAYLMKENLWKYDQAFEYLKKIRPCIKPNEGFVNQLKTINQNDQIKI